MVFQNQIHLNSAVPSEKNSELHSEREPNQRSSRQADSRERLSSHSRSQEQQEQEVEINVVDVDIESQGGLEDSNQEMSSSSEGGFEIKPITNFEHDSEQDQLQEPQADHEMSDESKSKNSFYDSPEYYELNSTRKIAPKE